MTDLNELADRYIALWNEPDPELRRAVVESLFASDLDHYTPSLEAHGHDGMVDRVTLSHDRWVKTGEHVFRAVSNADGHHGTVRFNWHMVHVPTDAVVSVGFDFLTLDENGRIRTDHQFIDA